MANIDPETGKPAVPEGYHRYSIRWYAGEEEIMSVFAQSPEKALEDFKESFYALREDGDEEAADYVPNEGQPYGIWDESDGGGGQRSYMSSIEGN